MKKNSPCLTMAVSASKIDYVLWELEDLKAIAVETRDSSTMIKYTNDDVFLIAGFDSADARNNAFKELSEVNLSIEINLLDIEDDGWSSGWKEFFKPVVLDTIQVVTPWMKPPFDDKISIVIDPGQAFGTGGHATTYLILKMIEQRSQAGTLSKKIFDVGIGSGILSIAAVKLGAQAATGIDIDDESMVATKENAARNNVLSLISSTKETPDKISGQWKTVLANIQLKVFIEYAKNISDIVAPLGQLLISGILENQIDECIALWPKFSVEEIAKKDGWAAICLKKV